MFLLKSLSVLMIVSEACFAMTSQKIKWLPATDVDVSTLEPAGYRPTHDKVLYVGRALFNKGLLVGAYDKSEKLHIYYNDTKHKAPEHGFPKSEVQILTWPPGSLSWQPKKTGDGVIPVDMVLGGVYPEREHIFICRGMHQSNLLIGYYRLMQDTCVVSLDARGLSLTKFNVLSLNFYGMTSGVGAE